MIAHVESWHAARPRTQAIGQVQATLGHADPARTTNGDDDGAHHRHTCTYHPSHSRYRTHRVILQTQTMAPPTTSRQRAPRTLPS